jgi:hypothetical protein
MNSMRTFLIMGMVLSAALAAFGFYPPQADDKFVLKQANGTVTVNGTSAISGATVFSDSTVTTAKGSSAVVSLGKLGRVELVPETTVKITFTTASVTLNMNSDATRQPDTATRASGTSAIIWNVNEGVAGTAITNDGQIIPDSAKKSELTIDTRCGNTLVAVKKGTVTLRAGDSVKQIAAGNQDTAGTARPGCTPGSVR